MAAVAATHRREYDLREEIAGLLSTTLPDVDVLAVELLGTERFCVYVDHPEGVDHSLCENVTNALTSYLEAYAIDVSSPGVKRPLRTASHFAKATGCSVAVRLGVPREGRSNYRGRIVNATDSDVLLELSDGETQIAYDEIARANLIDEGR
jgi:ribosome maturation factor RimP